jgi:hypothetical protein
MSALRCPHCGTINRVGANFCNGCGTDLRTQGETPTPAPQTPPPAEPTSTAQHSTDATDPTAGQPWLTAEPLSDPDDPPVTDPAQNPPTFENDTFESDTIEELIASTPPDEQPSSARPAEAATSLPRLISGVQGLLEPLRLAQPAEDGPLTPGLPPASLLTGQPNGEQLRQLRSVLTSEPALLALPTSTAQQRLQTLHIPRVFVLLALLVGLPALLLLGQPLGQAHTWPGVDVAFATIEQTRADAPILLLWQYDPASAGEMDWVALPLVAHLLAKGQPLAVVSQLPAGPATARRLFARVSDAEQATGRRTLVAQPLLATTYLPNAAAALPLLAQNFQATLSGDNLLRSAQPSPALVIIVAAQAEDVQQWLELAQPLNPIPVVAFTSAGADPFLRPYWDSGQLSGLVSGFDGAQSYQNLRSQQVESQPLPRQFELALRTQLVLQNWGHIAVILLLVLGNLAGLLSGEWTGRGAKNRAEGSGNG